RPSPLHVEYWTSDGPRLIAASAEATDHAVPLLRLRADRLYQYVVRETGMRGTFRTPPLPEDLASIRFETSDESTMPLVLVHLFDAEGVTGYAVRGGSGAVVLFWRTTDFPFGAARRHNGNFVFMDKGRGLVEVTPAGEVVHELPQQPPESELHH